MTPRRAALARAQGVVVTPAPEFLALRARIVGLAARTGVSAIYNQCGFVDIGGRVGCGAGMRDGHDRAPRFAIRALASVHAGGPQVGQPTTFARAIRGATVTSAGIAVRPLAMARAGRKAS